MSASEFESTRPTSEIPRESAADPASRQPGHGWALVLALACAGAIAISLSFAAGWLSHGVVTHLQGSRFSMMQSHDFGVRAGVGRGPHTMDWGRGSASPHGSGNGRGCGAGFGGPGEYDNSQGDALRGLPEGHPDVGIPPSGNTYPNSYPQ